MGRMLEVAILLRPLVPLPHLNPFETYLSLMTIAVQSPRRYWITWRGARNFTSVLLTGSLTLGILRKSCARRMSLDRWGRRFGQRTGSILTPFPRPLTFISSISMG